MSQWGMSRAGEAAIDAWHQMVTGQTDKEPDDCNQIKVRGDVLYSYGSHFELARPLRNKRGKIHSYLLNGDTYSQCTTQHQSHVRYLLRGQQTVIIPYEALNSAGIDLETVQIVHIKPDTHTTTHHRTTEKPPRSRWVDHPIHKDRRLTDEEVTAELDKRHAEALDSYRYHVKWHEEATTRGEKSYWEDKVKAGPPPRSTKLPESAMTRRYVAGHDRKLHRNNREWGDVIDVKTLANGTTEYRWDTTRHWLGESLIRARISWTTSHQCDWCEGSGWGIGPSRNRWDRAMQCRECSGRGGTIKLHHRWAYYLSGFDHEEARPLYFFAELPRGHKPATVAEAYEALKPDPVRLAEQMGRPIFRQGDIFGVPTRLDRKALKALGARIERRTMAELELEPVMREIRAANLPYVLNTNHTATEVAYLPDGVTLARGTMYHDPNGRRADHARRRIGDGKSWHVVIKNTVPIATRR
jgi:hypothetical protein